ncbi:type II toxin-antitoxin system RelE/ParE family toxin [Methylocystis echinoides]|uniref:Type II toxin-antitoxin system RelE/ParE family toxin n=1 Tax=Methylocystis echinoides TaxID=29468 RepID=A0A9W6LQW0_9HYPH|nr:type II toxin-antitoxin system RelE/ParE family toxin [Methylocystis echinoides]GLI91659.1 hypothetical protein LMG27198_06510 [Methylocystis echinoides]
MTGFRLSTEAQSDLHDIRRYLIRNAGPASARHVVVEIRRALRIVGENPGIGHSREDLTDEPVKFWPVLSYLIVYDLARRPVGVARILHGARDAQQMFRDLPPRI